METAFGLERLVAERLVAERLVAERLAVELMSKLHHEEDNFELVD